MKIKTNVMMMMMNIKGQMFAAAYSDIITMKIERMMMMSIYTSTLL